MKTKGRNDDKKWIKGVWLGVSHQTVTVTSIRADGTFSGTYFTPQVQIKTAFEGNWTLQGEVFIQNYTKADSFFPVPMEDRNRLEVLSPDSVILHTLPQGVSIRWNRIFFGQTNPLSKPSPPTVSPPSTEVLSQITAEDLHNPNPLFDWIAEVIEKSDGELHHEKELNAFLTLPEAAVDYWVIFQLEGRWGNGGMQSLVLDSEPNYTSMFFCRAIAAYRRLGFKATAKYLESIGAKTPRWEVMEAELTERDAPDEDWEELWAEIDREDPVFEKAIEKSPSPFEALAERLRKSPGEFVG